MHPRSAPVGGGQHKRHIGCLWQIALPQRNHGALRKAPATAELLNWLVAMCEDGADRDVTLRKQPRYAMGTVGTLLKSQEDQQRGRLLLE
jgi:hypothetical protein